ncbi:MAG: hypothetical protein K1060chlam2_00764, partial [Chlamydiae bacterium]|nr:hypothetical protein [Chlamydiota bacterium]
DGSELLIDRHIFDGPVMGPGWMWDEEPAFWSVPISGFNLEPNFAGEMVVDKPHVVAGGVAGGLLERRGNSVHVGLGRAAEGAELVAVHESECLGELLRTSVKESDNLYADCIFLQLGGDWVRSAGVVGEFLEERVGIDSKELRIVDGSGMSRYNLMAPHQLVEVLRVMHGDRVFRDALAVAGVDGTLKERMADLLVWGKTGGMTGVSNLCGYLMTEGEGELIFAIFVNNYVKDGVEIRAMVDNICRELALKVP